MCVVKIEQKNFGDSVQCDEEHKSTKVISIMLIGDFDFDFNCKKCFKVSLQRTRSETWQPFASARSRHLHKLTNHIHQHFVQVKLNNSLRNV